MPLTARQRRFAEEYALDLNATQAAIRAGYSRPSAHNQGGRLMRNDAVRDEIARLQAERSARTGLTADYVLIGLMRAAEERGEGASHSARVRALELLGKHLGLFKDKLNVETSGPGGKPVEVHVWLPDNERDDLPDEFDPSPDPPAMTGAERVVAIE